LTLVSPKRRKVCPVRFTPFGTALIAVSFGLALGGCSDPPGIAPLAGPPGEMPTLQPLEGLLPEPSPRDDPAPALAARAAGLRARAAAIGTP
jgi:hypothetical protein